MLTTDERTSTALTLCVCPGRPAAGAVARHLPVRERPCADASHCSRMLRPVVAQQHLQVSGHELESITLRVPFPRRHA
jgi:hypothetical protein